MPLKVEKRTFKDGTQSKTYWMRGSVAGRKIFRSTKKTGLYEARRYADQVTREIEQEAEIIASESDTKLFIEAAEEYIKAGGERRYLEKLYDFIGIYLLTEIDQSLLDTKARQIYPDASNASLVRWVYTPVIAVHRFSAKRGWCNAKLFEKPKIKTKPTQWAELDWFKAFWDDCTDIDLWRLTIFLPYTGCRITEALNVCWEVTHLNFGSSYIPETKNGDSRTINLPPVVVSALETVPPKGRKGKVFGKWSHYQSVNNALKRQVAAINKKRAERGEDPIPYLSSHKIGSHTYGTWMLRETDLDIKGLVDTGRWKDLRSAARYTHTCSTAASKRSNTLPTIDMCKNGAEVNK